MKRRLAFWSFILLFLGGINVAFLYNLKNLPYANYYVLLLAINIDLIALIIITAIILRKLIKVYLGKGRNILRKKLANILFLYLFLPILLLNVISTIVVLQSTKAYLSSKTKALSSYAERVYRNLYSSELLRVENYRSVIGALLEEDLLEEVRRLKGVKSVVMVGECEFEVSEGERTYILCLNTGKGSYRVVVDKDLNLIRDVSEFGKLALDVRAFVKTRDIISGVFVFFIVFITLMTLLATVWIGMLIAKHISEPIERLSRKAMGIAKGDLSVEIDVEKTGDEIEELSRSFRRMKENLRGMYERLERERDFLGKLLDVLPVGILYVSPEVVRANRTFLEMVGKVMGPKELEAKVSKEQHLRMERIGGSGGDIYILEDVSSIVAAERFRTWQEAVKRIAHEIKNPLTPIRLNLERLSRYVEEGKRSSEELVEMVKAILKEIDRISGLINRFKHFSLSQPVRFEEVSIRDVVSRIGKLYTSAGIDVTLEGDRKVKGDPALLRELFLNLINNSVEGGARRVVITVDDEYLDYRDDGRGLREDELESVFVPYYSGNPKGMGLGMAIVKKIVEDHGWSIEALPSKRGAHFLIAFRSKNSSA